MRWQLPDRRSINWQRKCGRDLVPHGLFDKPVQLYPAAACSPKEWFLDLPKEAGLLRYQVTEECVDQQLS